LSRLNLDKTELLFMPGKDCPQMDLLVTIEDIDVSPSPIGRNFGVVLDTQLGCDANITSVARSCSLQRPPDPALPHKPLQCIQNAAAHLVFNVPKLSHVTPLFRDLHWLPVISCIKDSRHRYWPTRLSAELPQPTSKH